MRIQDLPSQIQTTLTELSSDSGWLNNERQISFMLIDLPILEVALKKLPVVTACDCEDYSLVGALLEKPGEVIPVIYAYGRLLDGKPSLYVAMCRHQPTVKLVDASKILPESFAIDRGWGKLENGHA